MFVYNKRCKNCLFSEDRIVSPERAQDIIEGCLKKKGYFVCHKATIQNTALEVMCRGYYDKYGDQVDKLQLYKELGIAVQFIPLPDNKPLVPFRKYNDYNAKNTNE